MPNTINLSVIPIASNDTLGDIAHFAATRDYDETDMDFSELDNVNIVQIDEFGQTHSVVLSPEMLKAIRERGY